MTKEVKKLQELRNYTPHNIDIVLSTGNILTLEREDKPIRIASKIEFEKEYFSYAIGDLGYIQIHKETLGELELPEVNDCLERIIVSRAVASHPDIVKFKGEVYIPGELIRNEAGQVIGCKGLIRVKLSDDKSCYEPLGYGAEFASVSEAD